MPLVVRVLSAVLLAGALLIRALRWRRAAFVGFVALALASFPLRAGWPVAPLIPRACEGLVAPALALHSLQNTPHILLFALCFFIARAQFGWAGADGRWRSGAAGLAFAITLALGALLELAEGVSGLGHCRLRDLLPDAAGALLGYAALVAISTAWGYLRPARS